MAGLQAGSGPTAGAADATAEDVIAAFARTGGQVADARRIAKRFAGLDGGERSALLWSEDRGARLVGVALLVQASRDDVDAPERVALMEEYLDLARAERMDDADLVDVAAEQLVGVPMVGGSTGPLFALAKSDVVWVRRIAVVATMAWVKAGDADTPLGIVGRLVRERNDAVQTAIGWVLREVGKRASEAALVAFLERNGRFLTPGALRTATEHLPVGARERLRG
jgi:3-methyladenine DNA glycosylase AlkD